MQKSELAVALGVTPQRISKLLNTTGPDEFERVPIDLLYEIARITRVPLVIRHSHSEPLPYSKRKHPEPH